MRRCGNRVIAGMACVAMQLNSGIGSVSAADELFHVDATLLAQSWSQNDLPEISAISQPIKHDFDIKAAAAWEVSIGTDLFNPLLTWGPITIPIQASFASQTDSTSGETSAKREALSFLVGFVVPDVVGVRVTSLGVETSGHSMATDPSDPGNMAAIDFTTEVNHHTLRIGVESDSIFKGLSIGYRLTEKQLPQSIYVMTSPTNVFTFGVDPAAEWDASYLMLGYQRRFEGGLNIMLDIGQGSAKVSSAVMSSASQYINAGDASFVELRVEYGDTLPWFSGGYRVGYRLMQEEMALEQTDGVHLFARSESTFSGPYAGIDIAF